MIGLKYQMHCLFKFEQIVKLEYIVFAFQNCEWFYLIRNECCGLNALY